MKKNPSPVGPFYVKGSTPGSYVHFDGYSGEYVLSTNTGFGTKLFLFDTLDAAIFRSRLAVCNESFTVHRFEDHSVVHTYTPEPPVYELEDE